MRSAEAAKRDVIIGLAILVVVAGAFIVYFNRPQAQIIRQVQSIAAEYGLAQVQASQISNPEGETLLQISCEGFSKLEEEKRHAYCEQVKNLQGVRIHRILSDGGVYDENGLGGEVLAGYEQALLKISAGDYKGAVKLLEQVPQGYEDRDWILLHLPKLQGLADHTWRTDPDEEGWSYEMTFSIDVEEGGFLKLTLMDKEYTYDIHEASFREKVELHTFLQEEKTQIVGEDRSPYVLHFVWGTNAEENQEMVHHNSSCIEKYGEDNDKETAVIYYPY